MEVTFKFFPGQVFTGKVVSSLEATGQVLTSGTAVAPRQVTAAPFIVRVKLDDAKLAASLPAGTAGDAAIYTQAHQPGARCPQGHPAADRYIELGQPILRARKELFGAAEDR